MNGGVPVPDELVTRIDIDGLATLTLNRPDKLNALTPGSFVALRAHLDAIASDESVGCVVLPRCRSIVLCGPRPRGDRHGRTCTESTFRARDGRRARTAPPADDRASPWSLLHGRSRTRARVRPADRRRVDRARRHPRSVGARADLGDVGQAARTGGSLDGQAADVHEPPDRRRAAAAIGLVDRCVPDDELDDAVDALTREILANSRGTNRIVKQLISAQSDLGRTDALAHERSVPFGVPDDMRKRMSRS